MAAFDFDGGVLAGSGNSLLRLCNGWGWFDVGAEENFTAVTDSA